MKILDITIHGFGKFHDETMSFTDGMNVIYGKNEAGKSTIHTFIRSMFFGMDKAPTHIRNNYNRYEPWNDQGSYEGKMRVEFNNVVYRIERSFKDDADTYTIINETKNTVVENPQELMFKMLFGMSESSYINTISIGQLKSASEAGMADELGRYIANLNTSGNISISTKKAIDYLNDLKSNYEAQLTPDATIRYSSYIEEIQKIEESIQKEEEESRCLKLNTLKQQETEKLQDLNEQVEKLSQKRDTLTQTLKANGFEIKRDITDLRYSTAKLYEQYKDIMAEETSPISVVLRPLALVLGVVLLIAHTFIIYSLNPKILSKGNMFDFFSKVNSSVGENSIFLNPVFTIIIYIVGFSLLVFGIITTLKHFDRLATLKDITHTLQEVYTHQLGESELNDQIFYEFNSHLDSMERMHYQKVELDDKINEIIQEKQSLDDKEKQYLQELNKMQNTQYELDTKLKRISELKEQCEQIKGVLQRNDAINKEISAINLSIERISELSSQIKSSYGAYLNKEAFALLSGITGGLYNSLTIDDSMNVFLNTGGREVPMDQVSSGTLDQIYLTIRLASAALIVGNSKETLPLLFDDSFVMYDDERLKSVLDWISKNIKAQVLIFTCQKREAELLNELGVKYNLVVFNPNKK